MNPLYPRIETDDDLSRAIAGIRAGEEVGKALIRVADAAATTMMTDQALVPALHQFLIGIGDAIKRFGDVVEARNREIEAFLGEKPVELLGKEPGSNVVLFPPRGRPN